MNEYQRLEILAKEHYDTIAISLSHFGCMESLVLLKRFIKAMRSQKKPVFEFRGQSMGFHIFPFFADMIVTHCTSLLPSKRFTDDTFEWFIDKYIHYPEILQFVGSEEKINRFVPEWLIRNYFEQISIQEMTRTLVPRMLFFYKEIPESDNEKHGSFLKARDEVLTRLFRVSLDDVLLCTFSLGAIADTADRFPEVLKTEVEWMKPYVESDAMKIILSQLSLTRDEYIQRRSEGLSGKYTYIRSEPILIKKCPIVKFGDFYISPDPHMILARVTKYLHDSVYQYFLDNDRIQDYTSNFGEIYKDYIGLLLREHFGKKFIIDLDELDYIEGRKADWIVIIENTAIILECKAQRFPKDLKITGDLTVLESFVNERVDSAVDQLLNTSNQWALIKQNEVKLKNVNRYHKFIIFEEHFHLGNVIGDFLPLNLVIKKINKNNVKLISTLDLETIVTSKCDTNLSTIIENWFDNIKDSPTIEQYLHKQNGFHFTENNVLDKMFKSFFHM